MKNDFVASSIDSNRISIMGVGTLGVLMVHSNAVVKWPAILQKICSFGGTGVYIFVFLSAIGLYYSLKNRGGGLQKRVLFTALFAGLSSVFVDSGDVVCGAGFTHIAFTI